DFYGFFFRDENPTTGDFELGFCADASGQPVARPFAQYNALGLVGANTGLVTSFGDAIHRWTVDIPPLHLKACVTYWFYVKSRSPAPLRSWGWSNSASDGSGDVWVRFADRHEYFDMAAGTRDHQAFRLNSVPEPSSIVMLSLGSLSLGLTAW